MNGKSDRLSLGALIASMVIFGTVGIFRRMLPLSSAMIALVRGGVGALCLLVLLLAGKSKMQGVRQNAPVLCLSGAMIGFNWILLFEAYNHTSVATATLCYYMAPVFVIVLSPLLLREKLTLRKGMCALTAFGGMVLVSGVLQGSFSMGGEYRGVLLGLAAAALYAAVILTNKRIQGIQPLEKTFVQLAASALVLLPYTLLTEDVGAVQWTGTSIALLLGMGVIHTGLAYVLYFGAIAHVKGQTAALFSYIDPIVAILLSALLLHEGMGWMDVLGTVLILGAAVVSELHGSKGDQA